MTKVLQIEAGMVDTLKGVVGSQGSTLNPIQDADGNWFISYEEFNAPEFQKFFQQDAKVTITDKLAEIDYKRKLSPTEEDEKAKEGEGTKETVQNPK
jgi:hypothetical protein